MLKEILKIKSLFVKNGYNPYILFSIKNLYYYRFEGFKDISEFIMLQNCKEFYKKPGKLLNYLKTLDYLIVSKVNIIDPVIFN